MLFLPFPPLFVLQNLQRPSQSFNRTHSCHRPSAHPKLTKDQFGWTDQAEPGSLLRLLDASTVVFSAEVAAWPWATDARSALQLSLISCPRGEGGNADWPLPAFASY